MKIFKKIFLTLVATAVLLGINSIMVKAATMLEVTAETLNIRKSPSTDGNIIAMISEGVECELLEKTNEDWYKIKYEKYTGYVSSEYVKVLGEENNSEEQNANTEENTQSQTEQNNSESENQENNEQTNTENEVQTNTEQTNNEEENVTQDEPTIVYKKLKEDSKIKILPLINSTDIDNIKNGTEVIFITELSGWSYIQTDEISGWVRSDTLENTTKQASDNSSDKDSNSDTDSNSQNNEFESREAYISEDLVNVRKGAGTNYDIIKVLELNTKVTVTGEDGDWYQIKSGNDTGYVSKDYIADEPKTTSRGSIDRSNNTTTETDNSNVIQEKEETVEQTSSKGDEVVEYAKKFLGCKYVYGGESPSGFDCSGFTMYVYENFGINLPHGATSQSKYSEAKKVKESELQPGDIVFLTDYETGVGIGHCGIYVGDRNFIHASTTTYSVIISSLDTTYADRFYSAIRLF